jgi:hypothetical protein
MYIEHICFNLALAFLIILFIDKKHTGLCTAVIVISGCIPDIDGIFSLIQSPPVFSSGIIPSMAFHLRYFHSIGILVLYAIVVAGLLSYFYRVDYRNIALFAGAGFGAHLIEDALVYNPSSALFWPVSSQEVGIGFFSSYSRDFLGISNGEVLGIGLILTLFVVGTGIFLERTEWASSLWNRNPLSMSPFFAIAKIMVVFRSMFRNR